MKYATFELTDHEAINNFLEVHGHGLASDSARFKEDRVCFLYFDKTKEELDTDQLIASIEQSILEKTTQLLAHEAERRYWQSQALQGILGAETNTIAAEASKRNTLEQIRHAKVMLEEIKDGSWKQTVFNEKEDAGS